ncbi:DHA2 family efflux MFS transporter permease subunit [Streptomyces sp. NBC_00075]|uniref:DHA2 family efflux MFS transporter permease subunit n=1 Tax=Streptomyces sp. NBC_00075 TaxID=2975641 RepID=UPI0038688C86
MVIGLLVASAFVMIFNETIMSVALPNLMSDLSIGVTTAQWLTSSYLLTMAVVIPTTGFLVQRFPSRAIFLTAMALFVAGTLLAALAPGFSVLLAGRIVQASGSAMMLPLLMTTILRLIPGERRGRAMGTISVVIAVAPAIGPTMSGLVLARLGWRWLFWSVLPLAVFALVFGALRFHLAPRVRRVPLDVVSVVLSAIGFSGLVYGLSSIGEAASGGHQVLPPWSTLGAGTVALVAFVLRQLRLQRTERAFLNLRPLSYRPFVLAVLLMGLSMVSLFGSITLLPLYVQNVQGRDTLTTGLLLLPGGLVMGLLAPLVGRLYDRRGPVPLVVPGAIVLSAALWSFTTLDSASPLWHVVAFHVGMSVGVALMLTPLITNALGSLPDGIDSHGSAIVNTLQQVAGAAGTAVFITVMTANSTAPGGAADAPGLHAAFLVAGLLSLAAVAVSLLVRRTSTGGSSARTMIH